MFNLSSGGHKSIDGQVTRLKRLTLVALLMLLGLLVRLADLQLFQHQYYLTAAAKNCVYRLPIEPSRGLIYDRHGELLADNIPVFDLCWVGKSAYSKQVMQQLTELLQLSDHELARMESNLKKARNYETVLIKKQISEDELARFYLHKRNLPGVVVIAGLQRSYPKGRVMDAVLGRVGRINTQELSNDDQEYLTSSMIGKFGIEQRYERWLRGKLGYQEVEISATGHIRRYLSRSAAVAGSDLYLTIDYQLQQIADQALGDEQGAVVAIDPNNGEVLALVSHARAVKEGAQTQRNSNSDFNHAIQASFPPASTVKLYYALQALDQKVITTKQQIWDQGWFKLPNDDHIYYDWTRGRGHGWVDVQKAIVESSDTFFYQLAVRMGIKQLAESLTKFGFGELTGVDLPYENGGLVATPQWKRRKIGRGWYVGDTVLAGIGQGYMLVTPMQQALAVATIANRGKSWVPHLLLSRGCNDDKIVTVPQARAPVKLSDDRLWDVVIQAMGQVVAGENGTAHRRFKSWECDYSVAGKTGEAQLFRNRDKDKILYRVVPKHLQNHNWFVAFAPVEKPVIAIAVISEHSNIAVATARQMLDYYLGRVVVTDDVKREEQKNDGVEG